MTPYASSEAPPRPSGFFVLRTPVLAFHTLERWGEGVTAPSAEPDELAGALVADRGRLRERLRVLVARAEVREAVAVASPSLVEGLAAWDAGDEDGRVERALVRYLARMAGRPVPFGLFAGCTLGAIGEATDLDVGAIPWRRRTHPDMAWLCAAVDDVVREPHVRGQLRFIVNATLYEADHAWRFARAEGSSFELVTVERDAAVDAALAAADAGCPLAGVVAAVRTAVPGVSEAATTAFVDELVETRLLVPDLGVSLTGAEPLGDIVAQLEPYGAAALRFRRLASGLADLGAGGTAEAPLHVDLRRDANITLGHDVVEAIVRALATVRRITPAPSGEDDLCRFRQEFLERFGDAEVDLATALDPDRGVGFGEPLVDSPLLEGIEPAVRIDPRAGSLGPREIHLLERLRGLGGAGELLLEDADVEAMASPAPIGLPDAFSVTGALAASGEFFLSGVGGPSGANLLGRFCHGWPALSAAVRRHLREEEALRPDAIFAEIVHLPDGRAGNVIARPRLRDHDIVLLGRSGAPASQRILLADLAVSVTCGRVRVRSRRLDREVVPRLTTAHFFGDTTNLSVYRFLCAVGFQDGPGFPAWDWGPLGASAFLPRVRRGRVVLALARWRVAGGLAQGEEGFRTVQALRRRHGWPRFVTVEHHPIDLDNALAVDSFAALTAGRPDVVITEMWPPPGDLAARGDGGAFVSELVIPFVRGGAPAPAPPPRPPTPTVRRTFPPGSEWTYARLDVAVGASDRVLGSVVGPVVAAMRGCVADAWFFLRYADPRFHLRVRFHGDPARLRDSVLPALADASEAALASGHLRRVTLETYEREIGRYGGDAGIVLSERVFSADSDAALAIVGLTADPDARWRLALLGMDRLLADLGFDLEARLATTRASREAQATRLDLGAAVGWRMAQRFRRERPALEALLDLEGPPDLRPGIDILAERSRALAPIVHALRGAPLTVPVQALAASYLHMHVNRVLRSPSPLEELVLYDFLSRLYASRIARAGTRARPSERR